MHKKDTLPKKLSPEQEKKLLEDFKTNKESRDKLIEHNLRLVWYFAEKYQYTGYTIYELEELASVGTIGLIKAIDKFKPEKGNKLATYAAICITNEILMYIRKNKTYSIKEGMSLNDTICTDYDGNELRWEDVIEDPVAYLEKNFIEKEENETARYRLLYHILNSLSTRDKIIILRKVSGKVQTEIAKEFGISQSYVSRRTTQIKNKLKKLVKKEPIGEKRYRININEELCEIEIKYSSLRELEKIIQNTNAINVKITSESVIIIVLGSLEKDTYGLLADVVKYIEKG